MAKPFADRKIFAAPRLAALAGAVILAVPFMLRYQSSRDDRGTDGGSTRYMLAMQNNLAAALAMDPHYPERDGALLLYVANLIKNGYRTAPLTWLKYGAEERLSPRVMLLYAEAIEKEKPAEAAKWRELAGK